MLEKIPVTKAPPKNLPALLKHRKKRKKLNKISKRSRKKNRR